MDRGLQVDFKEEQLFARAKTADIRDIERGILGIIKAPVEVEDDKSVNGIVRADHVRLKHQIAQRTLHLRDLFLFASGDAGDWPAPASRSRTVREHQPVGDFVHRERFEALVMARRTNIQLDGIEIDPERSFRIVAQVDVNGQQARSVRMLFAELLLATLAGEIRVGRDQQSLMRIAGGERGRVEGCGLRRLGMEPRKLRGCGQK